MSCIHKPEKLFRKVLVCKKCKKKIKLTRKWKRIIDFMSIYLGVCTSNILGAFLKKEGPPTGFFFWSYCIEAIFIIVFIIISFIPCLRFNIAEYEEVE